MIPDVLRLTPPSGSSWIPCLTYVRKTSGSQAEKKGDFLKRSRASSLGMIAALVIVGAVQGVFGLP